MQDQILYTSASILDLLSQITELSEYDISISDTESGIRIQVGDSTYEINSANANYVEVGEDTIEEVAEVTEEAFDDLSQYDDYSEEIVPVESGIIKELAKTLLLGGMVRLSTKMLKKEGKK